MSADHRMVTICKHGASWYGMLNYFLEPGNSLTAASLCPILSLVCSLLMISDVLLTGCLSFF